METRMLGYEHAASVVEIAAWANGLIGKEVPQFPGYRVVKVVQFQALHTQSGYDALLLVEVEEKATDTDKLAAIKEADIIEIQQLTSGVGTPSPTEVPLPEE